MATWIEATTWQEGPNNTVFDGTISEDWAQGRSAFGGVVAAGAVRAARTLVPSDRSVRSVLVTFIAPANPGPVRATCRKIRSGRTLSYYEVYVTQGDRTCATVQVAFGISRATKVAVQAPVRTDLPAMQGVPLPYVPGITPVFTQHIDYRWTGGSLPFTGGGDARVEGWVRMHEQSVIDAEAYLGLLDAWPPPMWALAHKPAPASTVTWQVNFAAPGVIVQPEQHCHYASTHRWSGEGYCDFEAELRAPDGRLIALSRQLMAEFTVR